LIAVHRARARVLVNERDTQARTFLAVNEFSNRHYDAAQLYIDQLLSLAPDDLDVLFLAAENRLQLQDPDGAASYYDRIDRLRPGSAESSIGRGWVAVMKGDDATAARYWGPVVGASSDVLTLQRMMIVFTNVGDAQHLAEAKRTLQALQGAP